MQIIKTHYHPEAHTLENRSIFTRLATRSIAVQDDAILLCILHDMKTTAFFGRIK